MATKELRAINLRNGTRVYIVFAFHADGTLDKTRFATRQAAQAFCDTLPGRDTTTYPL